MNKKKTTLYVTQAAVIAAAYAAVTVLQNVILPGTASMAVQVRVSEALNVLTLLTPAAIPGLTIGCVVANLTAVEFLPLDMIIGSLATLLAGILMYKCRNIRFKKLPLLSCFMPVIF
ncbi:MAG: QueT transporter family protein, partial [Acutalibacteraceae bacterium]